VNPDAEDDGRPASAGPDADSERRRELVARLVGYSATHGLSDASLRPLAAAVGSSPRVLLYFFGSKEGLIREVLAEARGNQFELVERSLRQADDGAVDPIEMLWQWLTDPAHWEIEKLFFEGYARSLHDRHGAWKEFGAASVEQWLPPMERLIARLPGAERTPEAATLALATIRGLLLDLLATGDSERVDAAFQSLLRLLRSAP
jgi:AcrR family transcriptional regulator